MKLTQKSQLLLIVGACIAGFLLIGGASVAGANNTAVRYEQSVKEQSSVIGVQLQRRHDLILSLVSTVTAAGNFEKSTLIQVIEMRKNVGSGNVEGALLNVNALAEAYPQIKTVDAYIQLMTELSTTENLISEQRKTYNATVKSYQSFTHTFPASILLSIAGYDKQDYSYLDTKTPDYNPNVFGN